MNRFNDTYAEKLSDLIVKSLQSLPVLLNFSLWQRPVSVTAWLFPKVEFFGSAYL
jgi:hypothetical protein